MQLYALVILSTMIVMTTAYHDIYLGERQPNDLLLEQKQIDRHADSDPKLLPRVLQFTDPIVLDPDTTITRVEIIDYKEKKTSAEPTVILGGPGHSSVTIDFVSQRGHGIHFIVKIYGKRNNV